MGFIGIPWKCTRVHRGPHALRVDEVSLKMLTSRDCSEPSGVRFRGLPLTPAPLGPSSPLLSLFQPHACTTSSRLPGKESLPHTTHLLSRGIGGSTGFPSSSESSRSHSPPGSRRSPPVGEWAVRSLSASVAGVLHTLLRDSWVWWTRAPAAG